MKNAPWSHYQLFLLVVRHGGLSGAAEESALSPATVGRHMLDLEQRLGRTLFRRSPRGYSLTPDGETLHAMLKDAEGRLRRVEDWRGETAAPTLVRLAIGTWNAFLVSQHISEIRSPGDPVRLQFLVGEQRASLAHRENHIGIRSFRPEETNLAARRVCPVAYAAFRAKNAPAAVAEQWIAVTREEAISGYLLWPHTHHANAIIMSVSRPRSMLDLVEAGAGIAVLPCFIGDTNPRLVRAGPVIDALAHDQWLVLHDDDRRQREIRQVADRLYRFMKARAQLYAGRRSESDA
ncbi:LysR family transcriptional regulator [Martelella soudanensis]|uniref:LysR family transcriptional regulator n=1 Tax=unclassified Martelella TaxID=2629616 RepID=UPI0015DFBF98|nr:MULTISPECIES: LysR family transcriptional regulator [unclassified Martelella]